MGGGGFHHDLSIGLQDTVRKGEPNFLGFNDPELGHQKIIVVRRFFVAQMAFNDWENDITLLPINKRLAQVAEKLATRDLQDIKVASIINMVADRAVGIGDTLLMTKGGCSHGATIGERE
jgi:hypothetical protein